MTSMQFHTRCLGSLSAAVFAVALLSPAAAAEQERSSGGFLDNIFSRGEQPQAQQPQAQPPQAQQQPVEQRQYAQADNANVSMRIDRIENVLRQLTGTIEQLQHQNQQLQMQLKRMQDDTEYRFQQMGSRGAPPAAAAAPGAPMPTAPVNAPAAARPPGRNDAFDPRLHPNAPGAGKTLNAQAGMPAAPPNYDANAPVGAPGGRPPGAPLDLTSLAGNGPQPVPANAPPMTAPQTGAQLPPPPQRNPNGTQLATLPPSGTPKDEYELAYGYVLHRDYPLAEQAFRDFLRKYPDEKLVPDAQYWLGESLFQRQRYRDAAESFLAVSTKYEHSGKAPNALLRLGQSLAAMHQKEAACATFAEVARKYPRAPANVKRGVAQEQKRVHC
jgi:tol-pal system protein YbgF